MIAIGTFIWSYVGGVGYVVHLVPGVSDQWLVMNGSVAGGSYAASTSELEPYVLDFVGSPPPGAPPLGTIVRHLVTGELWKIEGYLTSAPYAATLALLQGSDRQATCYLNEVTPIDPYG